LTNAQAASTGLSKFHRRVIRVTVLTGANPPAHFLRGPTGAPPTVIPSSAKALPDTVMGRIVYP
jgi:hypothetical protein